MFEMNGNFVRNNHKRHSSRKVYNFVYIVCICPRLYYRVLWRVLTRLLCGFEGKNVVINEIVGFGGFFFFLSYLG
jgi:hypothetical protein